MARATTAAVRLTTGEREPCRLATTANLDTVMVDGVEKISGLKTIDGVTTEVGDRVLVKDQTNQTLNGIYVASVGYWNRAADSRTARTMQKGTTVHIQQGTANAGNVYSFQTYEPNIGTDNIVLALYMTDAAGEDILAAKDAAVAAAASAADDAIATAADRTQTGLDVIATAADRVQTGLDADATAADRVQTGLDRVATGNDAIATAADRVQTGIDRAAAEAAAGSVAYTKDNDVTLAANSDDRVASQKAIKTYVDSRPTGDRTNVVTELGIDSTGVTDVTTALTAALTGGRFYFPAGDYLIAGAGADAGGVNPIVTDHLDVLCHPRARFFTDNLDNDMFRFSVPVDGAGLPAGGVDVIWTGGYIDQTNQKNSTSLPFPAEYPPPNLGASATADGFSFYGAYTDGTVKCGINRAIVRDATLYAGEHWQSAGGDQGITIGAGCKLSIVEGCQFQGHRDLGIYGTRESTGAAGGPIYIRNNAFLNCFFAAAVKRSIPFFVIEGNEVINSIAAWNVNHIVGTGTSGGYIGPNRYRNVTRIAKLEYCTGVTVDMGEASSMGALLADGTKVLNTYDPYAFNLAGARNCLVRAGRFMSIDPLWVSSQYRMFYLEDYDPGTGAVDSEYNTFEDLVGVSGSNMYGVGVEVASEAGNNFFNGCIAIGGTVPGVAPLSATSVEIRRTDQGQPMYRSPMLFQDGSASAPTLARSAQTNVGIFFGTNKVGLSGGGFEKFAVNNTGVGFHAATPVAKGTVTGSRGGNAALASLLTYLASTGLLTDSSSA